MAGNFTYRKNKRNKIYMLCGIGLFALVMIIAIIVVITNNKKGSSSTDTKQTTQYISQAENVYNKSADIVAKISDGSAVLNYENPAVNTDYIKYTIKLTDTKEVLYESKLLAPGEKLGEVKLKLPANLSGDTYDIKLYIEKYTKPTDKESTQAVIQKLKLRLE